MTRRNQVTSEIFTGDYSDHSTCSCLSTAKIGGCDLCKTIEWVPDNIPFEKEFTYHSTLGSGGEGRAELWIKNADPATKVVVKVVQRPNPKAREIPLEAAMVMDLPSHPHIVYLEAFQAGTPLPHQNRIIYEFCDGGDLWDFKMRYSEAKTAIPEALLFNVFMQLVSALAFLHEGYGYVNSLEERLKWTPIIHRDIKPSNIFLKSPANNSVYPIIKLADFGLAIKHSSHDPPEEECVLYGGTSDFQAPERPCVGTKAGDVWSAGAVLHFLALGEPPVNFNIEGQPRSVIPLFFRPDERWSQWDFGSATEPWEGTYSDVLSGLMTWALDENLDDRARAAALYENLKKLWEFAVSMVGDEEDVDSLSRFFTQGGLSEFKHLIA